MKINEPINFRMNAEMIANLKKIASHVSCNLNEEYTYVDIIRCLLADTFPIPDNDEISSNQVKIALEMCSKISKQAAVAGVAKIPFTFTSSTIDGITSTQAYNIESVTPDEDAKTTE